jgi:hypothetical protein
MKTGVCLFLAITSSLYPVSMITTGTNQAGQTIQEVGYHRVS